jgi:large subunit ribosomal protein L25
MSDMFELTAEVREQRGKGASRRLRRNQRVPAILYGGGKPPVPLVLDQVSLRKQLENEAFYSHILTVKVGDQVERAVLKDLQRHPYKPLVLHLDLQRVTAEQKIHVRVPLHFMGESVAPGVKEQGGMITHLMTEVDITCLPADLPEFIELDLSRLRAGETLYLEDLTLPPGVDLYAHGVERRQPVVSITLRRGAAEAEEVAPTPPPTE